MFPENDVLIDKVISNSTLLALQESYLKFPLKFFNRRLGIDISPISISATVRGPPMLEAIDEFGITARDVTFSSLGRHLISGGGQSQPFDGILGMSKQTFSVSISTLGKFRQTFCVSIFGRGIQIFSSFDAATEVGSLEIFAARFFFLKLLLNSFAPLLFRKYCYLSFL